MKLALVLVCLMAVGAVVPFAHAEDPAPIRESIEWCDIWMPHANEDKVPRVLLVGDSITRGYFSEVEKRLAGKAYVARLATSRFVADPVFANELKLILSSAHFDVIHFNNGMHGWGYTEEHYGQAFPRFIALLRQGAPTAKLICATTTPVRLAGKPAELDPKTDRVRVRNKIATELAAKEHIPVDDLFNLVVSHSDYNDAGGVHFNAMGIQAQAEQVAAEIAKVLEK